MLGYALDPVGNVFGSLAGIIIDFVVPLKKVLDFLLGDPGALEDCSTAFDEIAQYLSETAYAFAASLAEITPQTWDETRFVGHLRPRPLARHGPAAGRVAQPRDRALTSRPLRAITAAR